MNKYSRISEDVVLFDQVVLGGVPQQTFKYALKQGLDVPIESDWVSPINTNQGLGFTLSGLMESGFWYVWIRTQTSDGRYLVVQGPRFLLY